MNVDIDKLRTLLDVLTEKEILEFEHEDEQVRVRIVRGGRGAPQVTATHVQSVVAHAQAAPHGAAAGPAATADEPPSDHVDVTSPFVGTFYRSPSPDTPSFVELGSVVRPGQTLCIVEAMKLMNEIEAEISGTVTEVFAQNGKAVEFGQKLFRIKKA